MINSRKSELNLGSVFDEHVHNNDLTDTFFGQLC